MDEQTVMITPRIPRTMRDQLKELADRAGMSMNQYIILLLENDLKEKSDE